MILAPGSEFAEARQKLFTPIAPEECPSLEKRIEQAEAMKAQARKDERIKERLAREKQFNKRVAINAKLRAAKHELERLTVGNCGAAMMND